MTAKAAADALIQFDLHIAESVNLLFAERNHLEVTLQQKVAVIREIVGTWSLSLAAAAAGVSEKQVLIAVARYHLKAGTQKASTAFINWIQEGCPETPRYVPTDEERAQDERVEKGLEQTRETVRRMLAGLS